MIFCGHDEGHKRWEVGVGKIGLRWRDRN